MQHEVEAIQQCVVVFKPGDRFEVSEKTLQALSGKVRKIKEVRTSGSPSTFTPKAKKEESEKEKEE